MYVFIRGAVSTSATCWWLLLLATTRIVAGRASLYERDLVRMSWILVNSDGELDCAVKISETFDLDSRKQKPCLNGWVS